MSANETERSGALRERAKTHRDQQPDVDREDQRSKETAARGVGGRRLLHRLSILTVLVAILTTLFAWNALLVYAVAWILGFIT